ncbi:MAG: peptidoglycan DD-metalloendopeptidase family protein [Balneolaceae bacterium]
MMKPTLTLLLFWLTAVAAPLQAQSEFEQRRTELSERQEATRTEIQTLEQQIRAYQERIEAETREYDELFRQYEELNRVLALQDEKIRQLQEEQRQTVQEMELVSENIEELEKELEAIINQYRDTLIYLYKHGRATELALILTSESINQLLIRSYYLNKFDEHRSQQAHRIRTAQQEYELAHQDLEETRQRNQSVLEEIRAETEEMASREEEQKQSIDKLQQEVQSTESMLQAHEEERAQLNDLLASLIDEEEEVRLAEEERLRRLAEAQQIEDDDEREAAVERYSRAGPRATPVSDEELSAYETSFTDRRGQLPWPVEGGTITERFGVRVHPVFNTRTENPGIDIAVPSRSPVRVVSEGYVTGIQPTTAFGDIVLVRHGRYFTVYGNLSDIFVSRGSVLSAGDVIGQSGDDNSMRGEVLFFMITDRTENLNPESWIQSQTP